MEQPNERDRGRIEGYAEACQAILLRLTGDCSCSKSYDPMTVSDHGLMHSYAFDMKDGGRHHPIEDYKDVEEVLSILLEETIVNIRNEEAP